ncbi:MAG: ABC transporter permease [Planctomycetota bacterium]
MRHLRRRRSALLAFVAISTMTVAALLTPLLPLERPDRTQTDLAYSAPTIPTGFWVAGLSDDDVSLQKLWPWDRGMIHLRQAIFGDNVLPPLMGRDGLGRCLMSRLLWGARMSLAVGFFAAAVSLLIGVTYGAVSGYVGGRVDNAMMRAVDIFYGIPFIFVVIFLITVLKGRAAGAEDVAGLNSFVFFVVVALIYWLTMARVVRGQVVSLREHEFVTAAQSLGATTVEILWRHIRPNLISIVIVYLTLTIPRVMLFEAFLSFLGLGVEAPDVSWGVLIREAFDVLNPVQVLWWLVFWPSLFLAVTLSCLNHLGDCMRDAFDPRTVT